MLRLKPSEITLTPEDIDDTLRRMARRQQYRASAAQSQRRARQSGRPPPPKLMPGAQRSVRDAITDLGNIPTLRPQPQPHHAIIAHVDDDSNDSDETREEPLYRAQSLQDPTKISPQLEQCVPASSSAAALSRHSTQLPFRLDHSRRRLGTEREPISSPNEQTDDSEGTLVEPAGSPIEMANVAGPATPANLRGGASHSQRNRIQSVGQESLHAPSPLRQTQVPSQTHEPDRDLVGSEKEYPVRYLQGYFERGSHNYTFKELVPLAPHTEPLRRTSQPLLHSRSRSSTDAPPSRLFTLAPNASHLFPGKDVFWSATAPMAEHSATMRGASRSRQHSSEASNMSLTYSYYELPETRQSSGEYPVQGSPIQPQYDGVANSREASRGTYRSVRLSEAQALSNCESTPSTPGPPGFASLVSIFPTHFGGSPLPAEPYAHAPAGIIGARHQPAISHGVSQESLGREVHPNAVIAAVENRISPLEALTAHVGRESQRLIGYQRYHQRSGQHGADQLAHYHTDPVTSAYRPHQPTYGLHSSTYGPHPFACGPSPRPISQSSAMFAPPQAAFNPPMAMADDPYTRGVSAHVGLPYVPVARPVPTQPVPAANYAVLPVLPVPRSTQGRQSGQRPSENATVGFSRQEVPNARPSQMQDQVTTFEQVHAAAQLRQPHVRPARRNGDLPSSAMPAAPPRMLPRYGPGQQAALSPRQGNAGRRSARMDPRLQDQENSGEAEMEMMRQEFDSIGARYDETQQGDVMDETPPRIGRVERHM